MRSWICNNACENVWPFLFLLDVLSGYIRVTDMSVDFLETEKATEWWPWGQNGKGHLLRDSWVHLAE